MRTVAGQEGVVQTVKCLDDNSAEGPIDWVQCIPSKFLIVRYLLPPNVNALEA